MFPSRALKKELNEAKKKLQDMEDELSELRRLENRTEIEQVVSMVFFIVYSYMCSFAWTLKVYYNLHVCEKLVA